MLLSIITETLASDFRYALRTLRKSPGFTVVALLSVTLGIGANTAIFTVVDAVLLKSLPVKDPKRLAMLTDPDKRGNGSLYCYRVYTELRQRNTVFSGLLARAYWGHDYPIYVSIAGGTIEKTTLELDSGDFFNVLGVRRYIGRTFFPRKTSGFRRAPSPSSVTGTGVTDLARIRG